MSNFHPLEVVGRYRDPQLQDGENLNKLDEGLIHSTIDRRMAACVSRQPCLPTTADARFAILQVKCNSCFFRRRDASLQSRFSVVAAALTSRTALPCKDKKRYLLTLQVSRYCLLGSQRTTVFVE